MLSRAAEENIADYIAERINNLNSDILVAIGESLAQIMEIKPSEAYKIGQILKYGGSYEEIVKKIAEVSGLSQQEIVRTFKRIAQNNKEFAKQFYLHRHLKYIPYSKDIALQNQVASISALTNELFKNISNTTTIGYVFEDLNGNVTFKNIQETYYQLIDEAIIGVTQGKETFASSMRKTLKSLGRSGLVQYESGRTRRLDSAVRMNILDGIRQLNIENSKRFGQEYGADGVEISVHENPAPDHEDIQGRQFSNEEYEKLETGGNAKDYQGNIYNGADKRQIAHYNCYHKIFTIVLGVSQPLYTDEQLTEIKNKNNDGFEFDGKHYTLYEGTQLQRRIETEIRKNKDVQILARASGDDFRDIAEESQRKINQLSIKYNDLCKASGLLPKKARRSVSNYRRIKA